MIQADYKIRYNKGWVKKFILGQIRASNKTYVYINGSASIFFLHVVKWTRLVPTFFWNGPESYSISENIPSSSSSLKFMWSIRVSIKFVAGSTSIACTSCSSRSSSFGEKSKMNIRRENVNIFETCPIQYYDQATKILWIQQLTCYNQLQ